MAVPGFQAQRQGLPIPQMNSPRYSFHAPPNHGRLHSLPVFHRPAMSEPSFTSSSLPSSLAPIATQRPYYHHSRSSYSGLSAASPFSSGSSSSYNNDESPISEPPYESMPDTDVAEFTPAPDFELAYPDNSLGPGLYSAASTYPAPDLSYSRENVEMMNALTMSLPLNWAHDTKKPQQQGLHVHPHHHQLPQHESQQEQLKLAELSQVIFPSVPAPHSLQQYESSVGPLNFTYANPEWEQTSTQPSVYSQVKQEDRPTSYNPMAYATPFYPAPNIPSPPSSNNRYSQQEGQHAFPAMYTTSDQGYPTASTDQSAAQPQERYVHPASLSPNTEYAQLDEQQSQGGCNPRSVTNERLSAHTTPATNTPDGGLKQEEEELHDSDRDADGEDEDAEGEDDEDQDYQQEEEEEDDGDSEFVLRRRSGSGSTGASRPRVRSSTRSGPKTGRYRPYSSPPPAPGPGPRPRRASTASITSPPSPTATYTNRRSRHTTSLPIPVPVPNLTKKSRGRRVPTVFGVGMDDTDEPGGDDWRGTRSYTCTVDGCGKCFARGEHLKRHVRSIHTHEKPHKCSYPGCGKQFSRHDNLGQHMRVHKDFSAPKNGLDLKELGLGKVARC